MDCLSAGGHVVSDAGDFRIATAGPVLFDQPNGAGRRAHEGPASDDCAALSRNKRCHAALLCRGIPGFASKPVVLIDLKHNHAPELPNQL